MQFCKKWVISFSRETNKDVRKSTPIYVRTGEASTFARDFSLWTNAWPYHTQYKTMSLNHCSSHTQAVGVWSFWVNTHSGPIFMGKLSMRSLNANHALKLVKILKESFQRRNGNLWYIVPNLTKKLSETLTDQLQLKKIKIYVSLKVLTVSQNILE